MAGTDATAWPSLSLEEVEALLCAPGQRFEMETIPIRNIPTRVWKNTPPNLRALVELSRTHGERAATILESDRVSFDAQYRAITALARALAERGVGKGDRVGMAMRNLPEFIVAFFAITSLGAIAVPLNAWWTGPELEYGLKDSGAKLLIADAQRWDQIAPSRPNLPDLRHVIVARAETPPEGTEALEALIGRPNDWASLPDRRFRTRRSAAMTTRRSSTPAAPPGRRRVRSARIATLSPTLCRAATTPRAPACAAAKRRPSRSRRCS